jgi:hypothetical protein
VRSRKTSFSSHGTSSSHSPTNSHTHLSPNVSISFPSFSNQSERSVGSLEKEIMRLQEVLKEREAEITVLEDSLNGRDERTAVTSPVPNTIESGSPKLNGNSIHPDTTLSPKTLYQFNHIRQSMENGNSTAFHCDVDSDVTGTSAFSDTDESLERLNELMLYVVTHTSIAIFHLSPVPDRWRRRSQLIER